jgi:DNA-binding NarL/FixJ family response regulator
MIRVVLADDQAVIRDALSLLLSASGEVEVLASVGDGEQAVAQVLAHRPDVALLDLRMPVMDGARRPRGSSRTCPACGCSS